MNAVFVVAAVFLGLFTSTAQARGVSVGATSGCFVLSADSRIPTNLQARMWCWGANDKGQLGTGGFQSSSVPVMIAPNDMWSDVSVGDQHACAVRLTTNDLYCWGLNDSGQLGLGNFLSKNLPTFVATNVLWVVAGSNHTCAEFFVNNVISLRCWGDNTDGQLGDGTKINKNLPVTLMSFTNTSGGFLSISPGWHHTCIVKPDQSAWCWGRNAEGQLGIGTRIDSTVPVRLAGTMDDIKAGKYHTCGALSATAMCWGYNFYGQLGTGDRIDRLTPTAISFPANTGTTTPRLGRVGQYHTCWSKQDGTSPFVPYVYCTGFNNYLELGNGSHIDSTTPVKATALPLPPPTNQRAFSVTGGGDTSCTRINTLLSSNPVKWEESAWCWGYGVQGQVGNGTFNSENNPAKVISVTFP